MVFPSIYPSEAFGIIQLESMVYGKPVINTNLPTGVPWVSLHKETGLSVGVGDSNELAESIRLLYLNQELVDFLGEGAIKRIDNLFSANITNAQIHNLYFED